MKSNNHPVALITGSARRIGAIIARTLHANNYNVVIHYCNSESDAKSLCQELNDLRANSAMALRADFNQFLHLSELTKNAYKIWQRLDILINNAADFFTTTLDNTTETACNQLFNINLKAPYFLAQSAAHFLKMTQGSIINITDIHGQVPLKNYSLYSVTKSGLEMMTKALAKELAPFIRVNAIAPSTTTLAPENKNALNDAMKNELIERTALKKLVNPEDIAKSVLFLIQQNSITGQILNVDCGRLLRN